MGRQPTRVRELGRSAGWDDPGTPDVAVVVATHGRADLLDRLLRSLGRQDLERSRYEVVIVDDGSPDTTPDVLTGLAEDTELALLALRLDPNSGPAAARNVGWRSARAPQVAFTDDDCVPQPSWLAELIAADGIDVAVGRTRPDPAQPLGPFSRTLHVEDAAHAPACNVRYRRADLETVGGFDEGLRTGEDTDLMLRIREAGGTVGFVGDALVHHDVSASSVSGALRNAARWVDLPAVVARHPEVRDTHLHLRVFWKPSHLPALLAVAGLVAAFRRPWTVLLTLPWLRHRLIDAPLAAGRRERVRALPGALAVDVAEIVTMVRGSVRHRSPVL